MSLCNKKGVSIFPRQAVQKAIDTYQEEEGKLPKVLVVSKDDLIDWIFSSFGGYYPGTLLGLKVIIGDHLHSGQIDLATDIKE